LYDPEEISRIHQAWIIEEYPGVSALIDAIHDAGLETAVFTNTTQEHADQFVDTYPAIRRLHNCLRSDVLGIRKPEAAAYQAVEDHVGFTGKEVVFFDDTPVNVEAARDFGWHAERIDPAGDTVAQMTATLRSLNVPSFRS